MTGGDLGSSRLIAKNAFLLTVGLLVGRVFAVFVLKKMTPILGPEGLGIWGFATDLTTILLTVANFGLGTLVTREIARARDMTLPILWSSLQVRWLIGAICYIFLLIYVRFSGTSELAQAAVLITGVAIFIEATSMACDAVLQAHDRVEYQAVGQFVSALVYFGLAFWWLDTGHGLMGVIWANLWSRAARLAVMVPLMLVKTGPWRWPDRETRDRRLAGVGFRWMLRLGLPLFMSTTFGILSYKVDVVMMLPNIFATAFFPIMARYGLSGLEDTTRMGERALRYMMLGILPLTLFIALTAGPVIQWFDREGQFPDSIRILRVVIWGLPFQAANTIFNRVLIAAGREKVFSIIAMATMLTNVSLNFVLIPRFSYFGAAAATIVSLTLSCALHLVFIRRARLRVPLRRAVVGCAAALVGAWLLAVILGKLLVPGWGTDWFVLPVTSGWAPFLAITGLVALAYLAAIFGFRIIGADDLRILWQIGKRSE
jgi:O-antigen/teichoic acid export membrane protein